MAKVTSSQQIRNAFAHYFSTRGHRYVASSSLIPGTDPTLLFTNAGMVQFKDVFLGQDRRDYSRAVSIQRCVRAGGKHNDLENVGYTARHHTFFEMLGNFSFGDYFKKDAIAFAWEFLTGILGLAPERLWVTVYQDDQEAENIWFNEIGIDPERFSRLGEKDNFWAMGDTGPCGPCSEIFYDHGEQIAGGPPGSPDEDGDRYIEIWNLVFMQYERGADGQLTELPNPSIDTGMGLERIAAIMQSVHNNYEIDTFVHLVAAAGKATGCSDLENRSLRVIADHIRSCAFLVVDGVTPANEGRGYVLRRIVRRAVRHGYRLGAAPGFFHTLVDALCECMGEAYPELVAACERVGTTLRHEEEQFARTLEQGMELLELELTRLDSAQLSGELAFKLYDTYGFPVDLTADIARERKLNMDMAGFEQAMAVQRARSKRASHFGVDYRAGIRSNVATRFVGYEQLEVDALALELYQQGRRQSTITQGDALIVLDTSSFYAESGGQVGDSGRIYWNDGEFLVTDTTRSGKAFLLHGSMLKGELHQGERVTARVTESTRGLTAANHSATHLLHAALRNRLGTHVMQKGSLVDREKLRFDFSHPQPVSERELGEIEAEVNRQIAANLEVITELKTPDEARSEGAMALFGEKYGTTVRVLSMGTYSKELCAGTHVRRTGDIGLFKLLSEGGVASGVRRIEAVTNEKAVHAMQQAGYLLGILASELRTTTAELPERVKALAEQLKKSVKEVESLRAKIALGSGSDPCAEAVEIAGIRLLVKRFDDMSPKSLRETMDTLKDKLVDGAVLLANVTDGKVQLIAGVTKPLCNRLRAGDLVNAVAVEVGGKGGGRPDMAQAGGNKPEALEVALAKLPQWLQQQLQ